MSVFGAFTNLADECPICLMKLSAFAENGDPVILQPCGHVVHAGCWARASMHRRRCPECRALVVRPPPLFRAYGLSAASQRLIDQFMVDYERSLEATVRLYFEHGPEEYGHQMHIDTGVVYDVAFDWHGVARPDAWPQLVEEDTTDARMEGTIQYYELGEDQADWAEFCLTVEIDVGDESHEVFKQLYSPNELLFALANQSTAFFDGVRDTVAANAAQLLT